MQRPTDAQAQSPWLSSAHSAGSCARCRQSGCRKPVRRIHLQAVNAGVVALAERLSLHEVATLDRRDLADFAPVSLESVARGCRAATRPFGIKAFDQPERTRGVCARRGCRPRRQDERSVGQVRSGKPPEQDGRGQTRIVPPSMTATVPVAWSWSISCRLFSGYQVAGADYQRMRMRPGARRT